MYVFEQTGAAQNALKSTKQNDQNIKFCYTYKLIVTVLSSYFSILFVHADISRKFAKFKLLVSSRDFHYFHLPGGPFGCRFFNTNMSKNSKKRVNKKPRFSTKHYDFQGNSPLQNCILSHTFFMFFH